MPCGTSSAARTTPATTSRCRSAPRHASQQHEPRRPTTEPVRAFHERDTNEVRFWPVIRGLPACNRPGTPTSSSAGPGCWARSRSFHAIGTATATPSRRDRRHAAPFARLRASASRGRGRPQGTSNRREPARDRCLLQCCNYWKAGVMPALLQCATRRRESAPGEIPAPPPLQASRGGRRRRPLPGERRSAPNHVRAGRPSVKRLERSSCRPLARRSPCRRRSQAAGSRTMMATVAPRAPRHQPIADEDPFDRRAGRSADHSATLTGARAGW